MACMVSGCSSHSSRSGKLGENLSFHAFPKNVALRKKWLIATNRTEDQYKKHWKVCSKHFNPECLLGAKCGNYKRVNLTEQAVPSLNLPEETVHFKVYSGCANGNVTHQQSSMIESCPTIQTTTNVSQQQSPIPIRLIRSPLVTIRTGYANGNVSNQLSSMSESCPTIQTTTNVSQQQSPTPIRLIRSPLVTTRTSTTNTNMSQNESGTNVLPDISTNSPETIKSQQIKIAVYQGLVARLEKRVQHLESIAKDRLLKINSLKQKARRLKKKNTVINDKLIELLRKEYEQNNGIC